MGQGLKQVLDYSDYLSAPDDGKRYELVGGELRMMSPSGWRHGAVVGNLHTLLGNHIRQHTLGQIFGAETGFLDCNTPPSIIISVPVSSAATLV